jgi:hypothetical protein
VVKLGIKKGVLSTLVGVLVNPARTRYAVRGTGCCSDTWAPPTCERCTYHVRCPPRVIDMGKISRRHRSQDDWPEITRAVNVHLFYLFTDRRAFPGLLVVLELLFFPTAGCVCVWRTGGIKNSNCAGVRRLPVVCQKKKKRGEDDRP